jgi:hypothetical protein
VETGLGVSGEDRRAPAQTPPGGAGCAPPFTVWLGHHSPAFTLATYVHFLADDLPDAAFLDDVTGPGATPAATSPTETLFRPVGDEEAESAALAGETLGSLRSVGG